MHEYPERDHDILSEKKNEQIEIEERNKERTTIIVYQYSSTIRN